MGLTVIITFLIISIYSTIILLLSYGLGKLRVQVTAEEKPRVSDSGDLKKISLLIPFRNEESHLADLLGDLKTQSYPRDLIEIIFVNDHSEDGSAELIHNLVDGDERFKILQLSQDQAGKKDALALGISQTGSAWILQIDADCRIGTNFVWDRLQYVVDHPADLVAGLVTTQEAGGGFTESFERLDLLSLVGSGAGSFFFGRPMMCNGANLLYTRELYEATRKFDPGSRIPSGDDMFLMIGARKLGKKLAFHISASSIVQTAPAQRMRDLIRSRRRWGSKTVHYGMADIQAMAMLVVLTNALLLFSPFWLLWIPHFWMLVVAAWVLKTAADLFLLYKISGITEQRKALRWFLPVSLSYYFIQLIILGSAFLQRPRWKGRSR